jgi:hypothetical protein
VTNKEIDEMLALAAGSAGEVDPALLGRVSTAMTADLRPVRPMVAAPVLAFQLLAISMILAVMSAWGLGFSGIRKLDVVEIGAIFPALLIFMWLAALLSVAETTPGGLRWKNPDVMDTVMRKPGLLLLVVMAIWIGVIAIFFHDYELGAFVPQGARCLCAGVLIAIPVGIASWMVLRRGYAVSPVGAGLAAGMLAGLAGLAMLEFHCPNLRAPHVMVWHTAVVPLSAVGGAALAKISGRS